MTKTLCCYNTIPDFALLSETEWALGSRAGFVDTSYLKNKLNCFDESALELALRFKEKLLKEGPLCSLTALSVGSGDRSLQKSLAANGYENVYDISLPGESTNTSSETISRILCSFIRKKGFFDVIVLGMECELSNNSRVPFLLAEMLGISCFSQVQNFLPQSDGSLFVEYLRDDGICHESVSYPVILAIGNAQDTCLRIPTLKQRLTVEEGVLHTCSFSDFVTEDEIFRSDMTCSLMSLTPNISHREGCVVDNSNEELCARKMLDFIMEIQSR